MELSSATAATRGVVGAIVLKVSMGTAASAKRVKKFHRTPPTRP